MGKGGSGGPAPTPPGQTARADYGADIASAGFAMEHGTPNQFTPGGSVTFDRYDLPDVDLGNGQTVPGGQGISNAYTSFNPTFQGIFDTLSGRGAELAGNLPGEFQPNINTDALRQSYINQGVRNVQPVWDREDQQRNTLLAERGIPIGSQIYNDVSQQTDKARNDYMLNLSDQAHQAAGVDESRQFQQQIAMNQMPWTNFANYYNSVQGMLAALGGQNNPLVPAQAPNVDVAGITRAFDDANQRRFAASQGGGAGIGGLLSGIGGILGALPFSDERLKKDVKPVGKLPNKEGGHKVYTFKYKGDDTPRMGLMAQEVEKTHPEAVRKGPGGYKMVDYEKATLGKHLRSKAAEARA